MNFKITINLLDVGLKWCFVKFLLYLEGVILVASGCTCVLSGARAPSKKP